MPTADTLHTVRQWVIHQRDIGYGRDTIRHRWRSLDLRACTGAECTGVRIDWRYRRPDGSLQRYQSFDSYDRPECEPVRVSTPRVANVVRACANSFGGTWAQACINCGECGRCCECVSCEGCGDRWSSGDRATCSRCDRCTGCCRCNYCTECEASECDDVCGECDRCADCGHGRHCSQRPRRTVQFFKLTPHFHAAKRTQRKLNPSTRYIAAEIEVDGINNGAAVSTVVRGWSGSIVTDGSLSSAGFEINTSPASGDLYVKQVREICAALNDHGAVVNDSCGLHVHIDARDLGYYGIRRLVKLYAAAETTIGQMVPRARRNNEMCAPCGRRYMGAIDQHTAPKELRGAMAGVLYGTTDTRSHRTHKYHGSRYAALNLHSWFYRGTVECRLFVGTTNADKITNWGIMWALLVDYAASHSDKEVAAMLNSADSGYAVLREVIGKQTRVVAFVDERLASYATDTTKADIRNYNATNNANGGK